MKTHATDQSHNQNQLRQKKKESSIATNALIDQRPLAVSMRANIASMNSGPRARQLIALSKEIHGGPHMAMQRQHIQNNFGSRAQIFQPAQLQGPEEEQSVPAEQGIMPAHQPVAETPKPNNTGLPNQLKTGVESLSGLSLDHVKVHYNSSEPAQLNALAYAQGNNIYVGPGQERHLPHEAWHVVQQTQGRVRPNAQMKEGIPVNDDTGLEHEADVMGAKASDPYVQRQYIGQQSANRNLSRAEETTTQGSRTGEIFPCQSVASASAPIQRKGETLDLAMMGRALEKGLKLQIHGVTDAVNLKHKGGKMTMYSAHGDESMADNPEFEADAKLFEMRLGHYIANSSEPALRMAAAMMNKAFVIANYSIENRYGYARDKVAEWFGTDSDKTSRIGAVPKKESILNDVFKEGNLRERMTVIFNFMWALSEYLINLNETQIGAISKGIKSDPMGRPFLDKNSVVADNKKIERTIETGKAIKTETLTGTPDPKTDVGKQYETRILNPSLPSNSGMALKDHGATYKLSEREKRHMFNDYETPAEQLDETHANKPLPWELGVQRWLMNENHQWVQAMRKVSLPLVAGPSATAWRILKTANHLGFKGQGEMDLVRLACIGYLVPIHAHSLVEVMTGAKGLQASNFRENENIYRDIVPLPSHFLRKEIGGGKFPDEPPIDRSRTTPEDLTPTDISQRDMAVIKVDKTAPILPIGSRVSYRAEFASGNKIDLDQFFVEWYWVNSSLKDTVQPRAVGGSVGDQWDHTWPVSGMYKIFAMISQYGEDGKSYIPMGALRADTSIMPQIDALNAPPENLQDVVTPTIDAFHFDTDERTTNIKMGSVITKLKSGVFLADITVKGTLSGSYTGQSKAWAQPIDAFRAAVDMWRKDQISDKPECDFPAGGIEMFAEVDDEDFHETFYLTGRQYGKPVSDTGIVPTFRAQGGEIPGQNATWVQGVGDREGNLEMVNDAAFWLNFGDLARMIKWLDKRTDRAYGFYTDVRQTYLHHVSETAIPEGDIGKLKDDLRLHLFALKELTNGVLMELPGDLGKKLGELKDGKLNSKATSDISNIVKSAEGKIAPLLNTIEKIESKIALLENTLGSGNVDLGSNDDAPHQYAIYNLELLLESGHIEGTVREWFQMEALDLDLTPLYEGSIGIAYEEFSGEDYYKQRNVVHVGIVGKEVKGGVLVTELLKGDHPAQGVLEVGDIIMQVDNTKIHNLSDFVRLERELKKGANAIFVIERDGETTFKVLIVRAR